MAPLTLADSRAPFAASASSTVSAPPADRRPDAAVDVDEAGRIELDPRLAARGRAHRHRHAVLVERDRADRRAKRRPLVGLLLEGGRRRLVVVEALVDHDVPVDALDPVLLELLHQRPQVRRGQRRIAEPAERERPTPRASPLEVAGQRRLVAVLAVERRERGPGGVKLGVRRGVERKVLVDRRQHATRIDVENRDADARPLERAVRGDRADGRVELGHAVRRRGRRSMRSAAPDGRRVEKSASAHPSANRDPERRMREENSKPFSRLRRAGWEAPLLSRALLAALLGGVRARRRTRPGRRRATRPIEVLVANDPETLDPRYATDAVGLRATRLVHAGLVRLDPDTLAPLPYLARGWRWLDPLTLEVELRDDVRFHSGAPLRPGDVVATLRAFASPAVASRHASVVDAIAGAREEGDHAVVIHLARPHATLLTDLELPILRADQAASPPAPDGSLDGLGPYVVEHAATRRGPPRAGRRGRAAATRARGDASHGPRRERARAAARGGPRRRRAEPRVADAAARAGLAARASRSRRGPGANLTYMVVVEGRASARRRARAPGAVGSRSTGRCSARRSSTGARSRRVASSPRRTGRTPTRRRCRSTPRPRAPCSRGSAAATGDRGETGRLTLLTSTERFRGDVARVIAQELADAGLGVDVVPLELGTMIARLERGRLRPGDPAAPGDDGAQRPAPVPAWLVRPAGGREPRARPRRRRSTRSSTRATRVSDPQARRAIYARLEALERDAMHVVPLWYEDQVVVTSARARAFAPSAEGRWLDLARLP